MLESLKELVSKIKEKIEPHIEKFLPKIMQSKLLYILVENLPKELHQMRSMSQYLLH